MSKIYDVLMNYLLENYQFLQWTTDIRHMVDGTTATVYTYVYADGFNKEDPEGSKITIAGEGDECISMTFSTNDGTDDGGKILYPESDERIQKLYDLIRYEMYGKTEDCFWNKILNQVKEEAEFIKDKV